MGLARLRKPLMPCAPLVELTGSRLDEEPSQCARSLLNESESFRSCDGPGAGESPCAASSNAPVAAATAQNCCCCCCCCCCRRPGSRSCRLPSTTAQAACPARSSSISAQAADGAHDSPVLADSRTRCDRHHGGTELPAMRTNRKPVRRAQQSTEHSCGVA